MDDPRLMMKDSWVGENRLGRIMEIVRKRILEDPRFVQVRII